MYHPGVRSLLDRICKSNGVRTDCKPDEDKQSTIAPPLNSNKVNLDDSLIIVNENKSSVNVVPLKSENSSGANRLLTFKEQLKHRMKLKRMQMRKEEEEDDMIDEEYHCVEKNDDADTKQSSNDGDDKEDDDDDGQSDSESDDDKEDEEKNVKISQHDDSSNSDFKLNLNDEDDDDDGEEFGVRKVKASNKNNKKANVYDFDDDNEDEEDELDKSSKDIVLTNTIPSNQTNQTMKRNISITSTNATETQSSLFMLDESNKQANLLDDLTNISLNYEPNTSSSSNKDKKLSNDEEENEGLDEEVAFDELAILCSGQFKEVSSSNKEEKKKKIDFYNSNVNNDLYSVGDDDEEYDSVMKKSTFTEAITKAIDNIQEEDSRQEKLINENSNDSSSNSHIVEKKKETKIIRHDSSSIAASSSSSSSTSKSNKRKADEADLNNSYDEIMGENDYVEEESVKKKVIDEDDDEKLEKQGFFEEEAQLSGSEEESDENYDGDSNDDNSIIFSGDEDELPSDSELKEQLGKIFHKDQMDQDKKQLRMFKEMYLADGELHSDKNSRKKQFRWKHLEDGYTSNRNMFSSDDDEDNEDEDDDDEQENENEKEKDDKLKEKSKKFLKRMANRNWRSVRHEREQFVDSKLSKQVNTEGGLLLSDDEDDTNDYQDRNRKIFADFSDSSQSQSRDRIELSSNLLLKKGQQLLKQSLIKKTTITSNEKTSEYEANTKQTVTSNENNLKKFSFLSRDKTYMSRLSSYVNKNFHGETVSSSLAKAATRSNNMVFSSIDVNSEASNQDDTKMKYSNQTSNVKFNTKPNANLTSKKTTTITTATTSEAKRIKLNDNCESIFNHIN